MVRSFSNLMLTLALFAAFQSPASGQAGRVNASIPELFHGRWAPSARACRDSGPSTQVVTIDSRGWRSFEEGAAVTRRGQVLRDVHYFQATSFSGADELPGSLALSVRGDRLSLSDTVNGRTTHRSLVRCPLRPAAARQAAEVRSNRTDRLISENSIAGTVTGMQMGDYLWVNVGTRGGELTAQAGSHPVDIFLDAHRNEPLTLQVQHLSRYVPEADGRQEIAVITDARAGSLTAAGWWRSLSQSQRIAARRNFENGALSSGGE